MKALRFFQGLIDLLPDFLSSSLFSHLIQEALISGPGSRVVRSLVIKAVTPFATIKSADTPQRFFKK